MPQPQQQSSHRCPHDESFVSTYGSCTDRSQCQSDGSNQQDLISPSVTNRHCCSTYGTSRSRNGILLFGIMLLVVSMIAAVAVTVHPSIASSVSLSMVTMESSALTSENSNPLIDILQSSSTIIHPQSYYKSKVDEFPSLSIDLEHERHVYNGRTTKEQTSITIEWTNGQFRSSSSDILNNNSNEKNIVALLCGESDSHLYYKDARTLSDAAEKSGDHAHRHLLLRHGNQRRRSLTEWYYGAKDFDWWGGSGTIREKTWHSSNNDDTTNENDHDGNNVWYIPSVPQDILDQRKCQAVIYYYVRDDEYVVIRKSTIIHL